MSGLIKYFSPLKSFAKSVWFFPALCLLCLLLLTSFKISGTSVGSYYSYLFGGASKDSALLAGRPREIRSDEWEFQTQMLSAQAEAGFPRFNKNIGDGQNMAVITDVPYKDWSVLFKPQNLSFFVLPLEFAFTFKWWFLAFSLVVSCYFFVLMLLPKKRLLAAGLSLCLLFMPFVQWWYQTITLMPLAYCFLIMIAVIKLMEARKHGQQLLLAGALSYLLVCFALVLYPPFQIPCAIATAAFLLGYFIEKRYITDRKQLLRRAGLLGASLLVFTVLTGAFLSQNKPALSAIRESYYPGQRVAPSGGFSEKLFMSGFLSSQLQVTSKARHYPANQSEASNFILLAPFLTLATLYAVYSASKRKKPQDWPLIITSAVFVLFMVRLFVPGTDGLFKILGLESVPHTRLLIGVGLAGFIQLVLFIRNAYRDKVEYPKTLVALIGLLALGVSLGTGFWISKTYPAFIDNTVQIIALGVLPAIIVCLLMLRRFYYAIGIFLLLSLFSAAGVNPLYKGMGPLVGSPITDNIQNISGTDPASRWAVLDNFTYENIPAMAGARSITGIYSYPQFGFWQRSPETAAQKIAYNRYAHTLAKFNDGPTILDLKQPDFFVIQASPCSAFFKDQQVKYFLAENDYSQAFSCLKLKQTIPYPAKTLYILEKV